MLPRIAAALLLCALLGVAACSDGNGGSSNPTLPGNTPDGGEPSGEQLTATLSIESGAAAIGSTAPVAIAAGGLVEPGLGAWTIVLTFDADVVSITDCQPPAQGLTACNPNAGEGTLRLAGATADGLLGEVPLATVTFQCEAAGTSDLTLTGETFADATIGGPQEIDETVSNGTITCS